MRKRLTIGNRLYLSVLTLFLLFAVSFIVFQQYREKQYKISTMDLRLQSFNKQLHDAIVYMGKGIDETTIQQYLKKYNTDGLRVTIVREDGKVLFDNVQKNYASMANHLNRPEIAQALKKGTGSIVDRNSPTLNHDYFYSATYFPNNHYVVRSALPYSVSLSNSLRADQHYIWFAFGVMLLLTFAWARASRDSTISPHAPTTTPDWTPRNWSISPTMSSATRLRASSNFISSCSVRSRSKMYSKDSSRRM